MLKKWGVGKRPSCNLWVCHLVACFCSVSSKGSLAPGAGWWGTALPQADQEGCPPSEEPASATCVIGAGQTEASRRQYLHLLLWGSSRGSMGFRKNPKLLSEPEQTQATSPASLPSHAPSTHAHQMTHSSLSVPCPALLSLAGLSLSLSPH